MKHPDEALVALNHYFHCQTNVRLILNINCPTHTLREVIPTNPDLTPGQLIMQVAQSINNRLVGTGLSVNAVFSPWGHLLLSLHGTENIIRHTQWNLDVLETI